VILTDWQPRSVSVAVRDFSASAVGRLAIPDKQRNKSLLWSCAKLATFCESVGVELTEDFVFTEAMIERFIALGCSSCTSSTRRTLRTNLRFVATRLERSGGPLPASLSRERSKAPYSDSEIDGYLAVSDTQPTVARRNRASGLICLGAGAGLVGLDLRAVRGRDVTRRHGGVVVTATGTRPRVVPLLARFCDRALAAASFSGDDFIVGGVELNRRNVTSRLIASMSGAGDLPRLEIPRLRATWLSKVGTLIGLPTFMAAAGVSCSQRLGDVVSGIAAVSEPEAVALLGGLR
jgi:integrase